MMSESKKSNFDSFYANLGTRIRDRRKQQKLSQADVCGSYITRNMLSRIENGNAHPSLDTLLFLSEKLNTPIEYFTCKDDTTEALYKRIENLKEIRKYFAQKQFKRCLNLCKNMDIEDDEINLIAAESSYFLAEESLKNYKLTTAEKYFDQCEIYSRKSIYNQEKFKYSIRFNRHLISSLKSGKLPDISLFNENTPLFIRKEFFIFVYAVCSESFPVALDTALSVLTESAYKSYTEARIEIQNERYEAAKPLLLKVMNSFPDFFTVYITVQDLELCYKETDDYKKAYEYANMRLDLLEKFNN
ncbi:MAG: helix-turn-helix domain-containing protein [Clostridia bacterium]|nr:helix-turn-helix domain-containing protein [Clostridia bacterium]